MLLDDPEVAAALRAVVPRRPRPALPVRGPPTSNRDDIAMGNDREEEDEEEEDEEEEDEEEEDEEEEERERDADEVVVNALLRNEVSSNANCRASLSQSVSPGVPFNAGLPNARTNSEVGISSPPPDCAPPPIVVVSSESPVWWSLALSPGSLPMGYNNQLTTEVRPFPGTTTPSAGDTTAPSARGHTADVLPSALLAASAALTSTSHASCVTCATPL